MSWVRRKRLPNARPVDSKLAALTERVSIQAHLACCELRLRLGTTADQTHRLRLLDLLRRYWKAGDFPHNTASSGGRRPVFIDETGTHCAVGHLMARTGAAGLATELDRRDRFARIEDMHDPLPAELQDWLDRNGLTRREAALIQPTYGPRSGMTADAGIAIIAALMLLLTAAAMLIPAALLGSAAAGRYDRRKALRVARKAGWLLFGVWLIPNIHMALTLISDGTRWLRGWDWLSLLPLVLTAAWPVVNYHLRRHGESG